MPDYYDMLASRVKALLPKSVRTVVVSPNTGMDDDHYQVWFTLRDKAEGAFMVFVPRRGKIALDQHAVDQAIRHAMKPCPQCHALTIPRRPPRPCEMVERL